MSIYSSSTTWGGQCASTQQSPINVSQSSAKPCDLLCDLVFDDASIPQANVMVSDEGIVLQNTPGLGSCKFNGEGYTCTNLLVTHPSHHTIENIQADGEVVAIFTNPSGKILCVSSLFRVNPAETDSSSFFNAFIPYANPGVEYTPVNLGDNWGLFKMVPPAGQYFVYEGSLIVPPCSQCTWVVFKSMINIDSNNFALLIKNVAPGSRPLQSLGDREVYFNDTQQLAGGPMPHDNKAYMRCKRVAKKGEDVKPVSKAPLGEDHTKGKSKNWSQSAKEKMSDLIELGIVDVIVLLLGIYCGTNLAIFVYKKGRISFMILASQWIGYMGNSIVKFLWKIVLWLYSEVSKIWKVKETESITGALPSDISEGL
jgi:carbonic anhydrase